MKGLVYYIRMFNPFSTDIFHRWISWLEMFAGVCSRTGCLLSEVVAVFHFYEHSFTSLSFLCNHIVSHLLFVFQESERRQAEAKYPFALFPIFAAGIDCLSGGLSAAHISPMPASGIL